MNTKKIVSILTTLIIILTLVATLTGLLSRQIYSIPNIVTAFGESVELYQIGLYARDSVSMASQAIAQDFVTLVVGVPLLIAALCFVHKKNSIRGWFLLTGTLGYFLYTYTSYSVLCAYNHLYLIYVVLTALSFYGFFLSMSVLYRHNVKEMFSNKYPVRALSVFMLIVGLTLCVMWLGRIVPTLTNEAAPYGLEHYSALVIQSLDLGFVVPASFVTAYLLHKRQKWGYLLSAVLVMKMLTMAAAVSAMGINMKLHSVAMGLADVITFPIIVVINICFLVKMLRTIKNGSLAEV